MKKRYFSIIISIIIICMFSVFIISCNNETLANNNITNDDYISNAIKYYKTQEKNFEDGWASLAIFNQKELIDGGDLIFKGVYINEENYTLEVVRNWDIDDENSELIEDIQYYTYYKFVIKSILKGDILLENTEIYVLDRNIPGNDDAIILQEGEEYLVLAENRSDAFAHLPDIKQLIKTDYWFSPAQFLFPIVDNHVYCTKELIDYEQFLSESSDNILINQWIEKQIIDGLSYSKHTNLEIESIDEYNDSPQNSINEYKKSKILDISNEDINLTKNNIIENWEIAEVKTVTGETKRISIPIDIFTDFLNYTITYYE